MYKRQVQGNDAIKVISYQSNNYPYLGFNFSNEKFQDKRVRQAMSMAVDRQAIIDYVYNGEATASTFVAPAMGIWVWDAEQESPLYKHDVDDTQASQLLLHPHDSGRNLSCALDNLREI